MTSAPHAPAHRPTSASGVPSGVICTLIFFPAGTTIVVLGAIDSPHPFEIRFGGTIQVKFESSCIAPRSQQRPTRSSRMRAAGPAGRPDLRGARFGSGWLGADSGG